MLTASNEGFAVYDEVAIHRIPQSRVKHGESHPNPASGMKIGIDCRLHYYNRTGIGRYIRNLVQEFPHCAAADVELILFQSRREREALMQAPAIRRRTVLTPAHHRWERWLLAAEIGLSNVDVLHSPDHVAPHRRGWQSVVSILDLTFLAHPETHSPESLRYYAQIFRTLRHAAKVITISDFTRHEVLNRVSIAPERVETVPLAADPAYYPRPQTACARLRRRLEIPHPYFLVVGTIEARKNLERLITAYASLPRRDRPHLVFAGGRGYQYERVLEAVQAYRVEDQVRFLGHVDDADLPLLYSGAFCLLYPSRYEGFGLPILEAMACGCPVITSNCGSMAEVAGDAAVLVDPLSTESLAAGIAALMEQPALRDDLVAKGFARARQFSWRTTAEKTLAVYRQVAAATQSAEVH